MYELEPGSAGAFRESISALKENNPYAASVYVYDAGEYDGMRLFTTDDGRAGFALKDDDVVSVFVRGDSEHRGSAPALMAQAVAQGGRRLDCFDTVLPHVYARAGFVPVARLKWNDDYAPDGWDYPTYGRFNGGRPDVVFMAYSPGAEDSPYKPGEGAYVEDYDEAGALVADFIKGTENGR
jgi:GNAT superfamily N-acetyltransferase